MRRLKRLYSKILEQIENDDIEEIVKDGISIVKSIFIILIIVLLVFILGPSFDSGWLDRGVMISSISTLIGGFFGLVAGIVGIVGTYGAFYLGVKEERKKENDKKSDLKNFELKLLQKLLEHTLEETNLLSSIIIDEYINFYKDKGCIEILQYRCYQNNIVFEIMLEEIIAEGTIEGLTDEQLIKESKKAGLTEEQLIKAGLIKEESKENKNTKDIDELLFSSFKEEKLTDEELKVKTFINDLKRGGNRVTHIRQMARSYLRLQGISPFKENELYKNVNKIYGDDLNKLYYRIQKLFSENYNLKSLVYTNDWHKYMMNLRENKNYNYTSIKDIINWITFLQNNDIENDINRINKIEDEIASIESQSAGSNNFYGTKTMERDIEKIKKNQVVKIMKFIEYRDNVIDVLENLFTNYEIEHEIVSSKDYIYDEVDFEKWKSNLKISEK